MQDFHRPDTLPVVSQHCQSTEGTEQRNCRNTILKPRLILDMSRRRTRNLTWVGGPLFVVGALRWWSPHFASNFRAFYPPVYSRSSFLDFQIAFDADVSRSARLKQMTLT